MRDSVKEKLDAIERLYTPKRLEKSKKRFLAVDGGQIPEDRYPFCIGFPFFNAYNVQHPPEKRLEVYLNAFLEMYRLDDDTIPYVFPGLNHATIPSMFGAEEIRSGIETSARKLIHSAEEAVALPEPELLPGSVAQGWVDAAAYFYEETQGRIPVTVCDMQGPFDACAQMWSYDEMFAAAYEEPEVYHQLLSKVIDAFILLWKKQRETLGKAFMGTHLFSQGWVPDRDGAAVSVDSLVMISPDFYREFYLPYLKKIYRELGEITIHSCGDFRHLAGVLSETEEIVAVNASQLTARELHEAGLDKRLRLLLAVGYEELPEELGYVREHGLNVRWSVYGVTPGGEKAENSALWTQEDWKQAQERIEEVKRLMRAEKG